METYISFFRGLPGGPYMGGFFTGDFERKASFHITKRPSLLGEDSDNRAVSSLEALRGVPGGRDALLGTLEDIQ
jgi:hypothetical protein